MSRIIIDFIPHKDQAYPTVGDWREIDGDQHIRVSNEIGQDYAFLVAIHELIEWKLCQKHGITEKQVDEFDIAYEKNRHPNDHTEPGDCPQAPYFLQHKIATRYERGLAGDIGVEWHRYEDAINALP